MSNLMKNMMKKQKGENEDELEFKNPYINKNGEEEDSNDEEENDPVGELNEYHNFGKSQPVKPTENINFGTKPPPGPIQSTPSDNDLNKPTDYSAFFQMELMSNGTPIYTAGTEGPVFLCCHGAGHSALSFAVFSKEITKFAKIACFDFRGHGYSEVQEDRDVLEVDILVDDTIKVLEYLMEKNPEDTFVFLGHSMGGSIAARASAKAKENEAHANRVVGLLVIDVVEGTAIEALPFMESIVAKRPKKFKSVEDVIEWTIKSRTLMNRESAKVSIPPQVMEKEMPPTGQKAIVWKNDLMASEKYWMGWFKGLSKIFQDIQIPKQLLLAGNDRMDTDLTIAQMQGRFRQICFPSMVGHCMMEDDPKETAKSCHLLLEKFRIPMNMTDVQKLKQVGVGLFKNSVKPYN